MFGYTFQDVFSHKEKPITILKLTYIFNGPFPTFQHGPLHHEDSNYDFEKKTIFTRFVYEASLVHEDIPKDRVNDRILLSLEEHKNYKWISSLEELNEEKIVPYLLELIHN